MARRNQSMRLCAAPGRTPEDQATRRPAGPENCARTSPTCWVAHGPEAIDPDRAFKELVSTRAVRSTKQLQIRRGLALTHAHLHSLTPRRWPAICVESTARLVCNRGGREARPGALWRPFRSKRTARVLDLLLALANETRLQDPALAPTAGHKKSRTAVLDGLVNAAFRATTRVGP